MEETRSDVAASSTRVELTHLVLPQFTNALGTIFGGQVAAWIDMCAAISAQRFCRGPVVTASIDELHFLAPIQRGHIAIFRSMVNQSWNHSLEVGVRVEGEDPFTGHRVHTAAAYCTFVALDDAGRPARVPRLHADTEDAVRRMHDAEQRRAQRLRSKGERLARHA
jgi:acyl-CoA hydrolase